MNSQRKLLIFLPKDFKMFNNVHGLLFSKIHKYALVGAFLLSFSSNMDASIIEKDWLNYFQNNKIALMDSKTSSNPWNSIRVEVGGLVLSNVTQEKGAFLPILSINASITDENFYYGIKTLPIIVSLLNKFLGEESFAESLVLFSSAFSVGVADKSGGFHFPVFTPFVSLYMRKSLLVVGQWFKVIDTKWSSELRLGISMGPNAVVFLYGLTCSYHF